MKIFVAGGTGAIGRPLIAELLAKGHALVVLTRSQDKARALAAQGIEPAVADVFDPDAVKAVVGRAQPDIVIEQLTALPRTYTRQSLTAAADFNTRIRVEGGANVLAAAQAAGVRRYLRQSIGIRAAPGLGLADEGTPLAFDASPAVAADARIVSDLETRLLGLQNIEGIALRYGFFYGPGTWFNPDGDVARQVRQQQYPIIGNGEGVWSWLHIEDAAIATVAAAERGNPGIYLIANDRPLAVREWLPAFARWLNAPPPPQISVEDVLRTNGADAVYYGTQMRGVSNAKAKRELTFQPRPLEWVVDTAPTHVKQVTGNAWRRVTGALRARRTQPYQGFNGRLEPQRGMLTLRCAIRMPTSANQVWAALAWGAVSSVGLLVGAIAGSFFRMPHHAIAMAMSVGAGLLLASVSLKVAADAIQIAGPLSAALSLLLGAALFSASNALLARFGAAHRKRCGECVQQPAESQQPGSGVAIALGNALDAVPDAIVLGIALQDRMVPLALVFAFSVGNLPEALSSAAGMRTAGRSYTYILLLWSAIAIGAAVAIAAGYVGFGWLSPAWPPRLQAFGAGALLAMTAETMIPEAFHNSPRFSGLLAAFGFGLLLLVDATTR